MTNNTRHLSLQTNENKDIGEYFYGALLYNKHIIKIFYLIARSVEGIN